MKISSVDALQARADKILAQRGLCSKKTYSRSKRTLLEKNLFSLKEDFARKKLILAQRGLCSKKTYSRSKRALLEKNLFSLKEDFARKKLILAKASSFISMGLVLSIAGLGQNLGKPNFNASPVGIYKNYC
ncbi:MAG: hypothetical protein IJ832_08655 [Bacteroidaceae bacterium]|nr:hypothetical protein [Bacteroidaceae bacterium]